MNRQIFLFCSMECSPRVQILGLRVFSGLIHVIRQDIRDVLDEKVVLLGGGVSFVAKHSSSTDANSQRQSKEWVPSRSTKTLTNIVTAFDSYRNRPVLDDLLNIYLC